MTSYLLEEGIVTIKYESISGPLKKSRKVFPLAFVQSLETEESSDQSTGESLWIGRIVFKEGEPLVYRVSYDDGYNLRHNVWPKLENDFIALNRPLSV